jgi:hypothetical protein
MAVCANCGRTIGKLETPHDWQGHIVCAECRSRLSPVIREEPIETRPVIPGIFKLLAWLLVIIILLWAVSAIQDHLNRQADINEEILHNGQGP